MMILTIIISTALIIAGVLYYYMTKPMYEVGMVKKDYILDPFKQIPEKEGYWNVEKDIDLFYFIQGSGKKKVLVIHGGPGYPFTEPYKGLGAFTDKFTFYYYHQRGCGKSTKPIDGFSSGNFYKNRKALVNKLGIGVQIADIERIRKIIKVDKLIIIGHSFGAFIASLYASEFPENVEKLILISPANVMKMPTEDKDLFEQIKQYVPTKNLDEYKDYLDRYLNYKNIFSKDENELASIGRGFMKYYVLAMEKKGETYLNTGTDINNNGGWMPHALFMSIGLRHDFSPALKEIHAPVLIIHGANDFQSEKATKRYDGYFDNSKFHIIENAGHFSYNEKPEEFIKIIDPFLRGGKSEN
jgi:proline iminopeptidase